MAIINFAGETYGSDVSIFAFRAGFIKIRLQRQRNNMNKVKMFSHNNTFNM